MRPGQAPALHHRCVDHDIPRRLALAVGQRPHAVADVELQVPQQPDEGRDVVLNGTGSLGQDEQVDVGMGVQLAASVAADGEQCEIVVAVEPVLPDLRQERVDEPRPFRH